MRHGFKFDGLLQEDSWLTPAYVTVNEQGIVQSIRKTPPVDIPFQEIKGYAIPGLVNAHSHAFQYAIAGLNEIHDTSKTTNDFWSWRNHMYQVALTIGPEELESIAAFLYSEMLRLGYSHVVEFHYLHHDKKGNHYDNPAELGLRLVSAAKTAGIKITLLPIFYQKGGFGIEPETAQRRFIVNNVDEYFSLFEASSQAIDEYEYANTGYGLHSLRAVDSVDLINVTNHFIRGIPVHMHLAEQKKEVKDCISYLGSSPTEWMLNNINVTNDYHFVHATHMTDEETRRLAKSGANVVLCPSTEGNLGDGLFNLKKFQEAGGRWSIGTDSHVGLNPFEELRILDYGQRITSHKRNTFMISTQGNSGKVAMNQIIKTGRNAAGIKSLAFFESGNSFDCLVIDSSHPLINTTSSSNLSNTIVYSSDTSMNLGTIVNGKWIVKAQQHLDGESIKSDFLDAVKRLKIR